MLGAVLPAWTVHKVTSRRLDRNGWGTERRNGGGDTVQADKVTERQGRMLYVCDLKLDLALGMECYRQYYFMPQRAPLPLVCNACG